jgi:hypothetical protein
MKNVTHLNTILYNGSNSDLTVEFRYCKGVDMSTEVTDTIIVPYSDVEFLPLEELCCSKILNSVDNIVSLFYQSTNIDQELNRRILITIKDNLLGFVILNIEPEFKIVNDIPMLVNSSNFNESEILNIIDVAGNGIAMYIQNKINE